MAVTRNPTEFFAFKDYPLEARIGQKNNPGKTFKL
jgi:hypothetical protein